LLLGDDTVADLHWNKLCEKIYYTFLLESSSYWVISTYFG